MLAAFREGLRETGYVEGQNIAIEYRWAEAQFDRLPALAADLVDRKVDVIVTEGGAGPVVAAKQATSAIPVVFHTNSNPVAMGLVASLARPGGNLTGISLHGLGAKRVELVCELVPEAKTIAVLVNPNDPSADADIRDAQEAAREGSAAPCRQGEQRQRDRARLRDPQRTASRWGRRRRQCAVQQANGPARSAGITSCDPGDLWGAAYVETGGLLSYGSDLAAVYRQKGIYAGKILKGAKPADLPVEQPTKVELVINLKTAKALGLTVPPLLLARADEVIE
jgi:putative ABC transport system substrate-binding protein